MASPRLHIDLLFYAGTIRGLKTQKAVMSGRRRDITASLTRSLREEERETAIFELREEESSELEAATQGGGEHRRSGHRGREEESPEFRL